MQEFLELHELTEEFELKQFTKIPEQKLLRIWKGTWLPLLTCADYGPFTLGLKMYSYYIAQNSITNAENERANRVQADTLTRVEMVPQKTLDQYLFITTIDQSKFISFLKAPDE